MSKKVQVNLRRYRNLSMFMWIVAAVVATLAAVQYMAGMDAHVIMASEGLAMPFMSFGFLFAYKGKEKKRKRNIKLSHYTASLLMRVSYILAFASAVIGILYASTGVYPNDATQTHIITLLCSANALVFGMVEEDTK